MTDDKATNRAKRLQSTRHWTNLTLKCATKLSVQSLRFGSRLPRNGIGAPLDSTAAGAGR